MPFRSFAADVAGLGMAVVLLGACQAPAGSGETDGWSVLKGDHFLVSYRRDRSGAESVLRRAEDCYDRIAPEMGYTRHAGFWLWENRVGIRIFDDCGEFRRVTGAPVWAGAKADYRRREISTYVASREFGESLLSHEIAHFVLRDFVGGARAGIPLWLDEGVAQWHQPGTRGQARETCVALLKRNQLIPLSRLARMDVRKSDDAPAASVFYAEAATLVGFLIRKGGIDRFRVFCRGACADGDVEDSIRHAYPGMFTGWESVENGWRKDMEGE